jgi:hypothetical protein
MGLQARLMSQALRKLTGTINKTGCVCIFINQLREKIGVMFGNPETTTGGNALKFYASIRLDIRRIGQLKEGNDIVGNRTKVKIAKNKVAPPFRTVEFDIIYGDGVSKVGEIVDLGVDLEIVKKSGSWFSYNDTKLGQGRDAVKQLLLDNPEMATEIEAKIKERAFGRGGRIVSISNSQIPWCEQLHQGFCLIANPKKPICFGSCILIYTQLFFHLFLYFLKCNFSQIINNLLFGFSICTACHYTN